MTSTSIADISALEAIQGSANAQMGVSSMSAFQSVAVENATYKEIRKPATPDEAKEIEKLKKELESLEKEYTSKVPPIFKELDKNTAEQAVLSTKLKTLKERESQLYAKGDQIQLSIVPKESPIKSQLEKLGVQVVKCVWDDAP